ncbi:dihydrofolate reductase family protein [Sphingobacterium sp. WM]|uniref:dihydrofolate reductase family protein n=1 Tax=Sphingobacterium sp. WM TaxID=3031802 RepID=UPI00240D5538|nr:dihydrofolate reductase family protein [Sphingobacterium sp. WM]WFB62141.1 dihydrofolate reductase family protein [Sphingobacterium sp. WM]
MRKLFLFIACSLDGYIAKNNDDLSFLSTVEKEGEDYGYGKFTDEIDTIIIGRKTFDYVEKNIGIAHYDQPGRRVFVITSVLRPNVGNIHFTNVPINELVEELKNQEGKGIYCDGGAQIIDALLQYDMIDEMIISIVPILLGEGTRLFKDHRPEQVLEFISSKSFDTGLVQLHYKRKRI